MYVSGDFWRICEVCGFRYRASQTKKRWDGLIVCFADFEERHPQDFVEGRVDHQNAPDPRPETVDNITGALTTQISVAAAAGVSTVSVVSSVRFLAGDHIGLLLSDGNLYRAIIGNVPDTSSLTLTAPLPRAVSVDALVIDYSAVSTPSVG